LIELSSSRLVESSAALSLLLTVGLAQAIAAVYAWTFRGMSYSQGLVHSITST
jgi:hypothetical protein